MPIQRCVFKKTNLLIVALLLVLSVCVAAQVTTADVVGRVTDSSGAVLPGVTIVIENLGTGATRSSVSSDTGDYVFNLLPSGRYGVRFELPGFKTFSVASIVLAAGDRARIDAQMTVGAVNETVNVEEQAPLLQTDTATLGTAITGRLVQDLPLNGRNYVQLTQLVTAKFRQNQFGGSIGGPIKKDRTFFFGDYEKLSIRQGIPIDAIIPTGRQRIGDLGENCASLGGSFDSSGLCSVAPGQLNVA